MCASCFGRDLPVIRNVCTKEKISVTTRKHSETADLHQVDISVLQDSFV